jgi:hypothetical protein
MPIEWKPAADYDGQRGEAERRIAARDPDDWPTGSPGGSLSTLRS